MVDEKERETKQYNIKLYVDQIERLDNLWKRRLLKDRSELIRIELDKVLAEEDKK
jgi:metal-responsive CopG/Arc/MetJ family transcriptional regulator